MPMVVVVDQTIRRLKKEEKKKPPNERLIVPTVRELAINAGISKTAYINFMKNRNDTINKNVVESTLKLLKDCGHNVGYNDIVSFR